LTFELASRGFVREEGFFGRARVAVGSFCTCFGAQDEDLEGDSEIGESSFIQHSYLETVLDPSVPVLEAASRHKNISTIHPITHTKYQGLPVKNHISASNNANSRFRTTKIHVPA
jgi:hypothetical protein